MEDAASFFFPRGAVWTSLTEVRLNDKNGKSAGNIDVVLVSYDKQNGRIMDFGALEIQSVYISGNVRRPFEHFMEDTAHRHNMDWTNEPNVPRPDYLSSSRKRLAPQWMFKGGILNAWGKKLAVALHKGFFGTLPSLPGTDPLTADIAWLIYDLPYNAEQKRYHLVHERAVYTSFRTSLERIAKPEPGPVEEFIRSIQSKLDHKLEEPLSPDTSALQPGDLFK